MESFMRFCEKGSHGLLWSSLKLSPMNWLASQQTYEWNRHVWVFNLSATFLHYLKQNPVKELGKKILRYYNKFALNWHVLPSSHRDCNATCIASHSSFTYIPLAGCWPVHDNFTRTAKLLKWRNADQLNWTNITFSKLQYLNSSIVGSKAGIFAYLLPRK